jgi:SAM-dependent methyltransferase
MVHFTHMLKDRRRRDAYVAALEQTVTSDSVVLDLGAGPGFFAIKAAQMGARRVYAVDLLDAVNVVPMLAEANGLADRVTAWQGDVLDIELPEPPDIVVADLRGVLPLHTVGLAVVADVQERVMAPDGIWLQRRDELRAALTSADRGDLSAAWDEPGLDFDAARQLTLGLPRRIQLEPGQLLSSAECWASIDYTDPESLRAQKRRGTVTVGALADGQVSSVAIWFDAYLVNEIQHSSGPGESYSTYGQFNLPLVEPLPVRAGESITIDVRFNRLDGGDVWRWSVAGPAGRRDGSTFDAIPMSPTTVNRGALVSAASTPSPEEQGR